MKQSLGLVEIIGLSTAVFVADVMVKAANVQIIEMENSKGLGYMTIKIQGDIGAVKAAVDAGCQLGRISGKLAGCKVIPRPSDYVEQTFCNPKGPVPSALPGPEHKVTEIPNDRVAETPETPETPATLERSEVPEITERSEISETTEKPEIPEIPETTERSEVSEITERSEVSEITERSEVSEITEITEIPEIPKTPKTPEQPEPPEQLNTVPAEESGKAEILTEESEKQVNAVKKPTSGTAKKTTRKTSHEKGDQ
jgi:microcompartment protein CcmL/EutN